ncbi:ABC transporter ATP-binding protein [Candidatus Kaiserbacteria bacterium]|nr:ABC transporter ATP-binding protein [Candidatus Kaiserbacteria bacterium]
MSEKTPIVRLAGASYRYPEAKAHMLAFKDVSFSIAQGEFVSLIGPSGTGKTTVLRTIAGVITESKGTIERNFKRLAMVFQGHGIFPWQTVLENAAFGLAMDGMGKKEREKIAREKLTEAGLAGLEDRYPHQLSGGQKQRVAIARAIAIEPDLLLMDEPFASLDSLTATSLKKDVLLMWHRYHMTVVMVNHLIPDAVELSDRVIVMGGEPGIVKHSVFIALPRPRNTRSEGFYKESDALIRLLEH